MTFLKLSNLLTFRKLIAFYFILAMRKTEAVVNHIEDRHNNHKEETLIN